MKNKFILLFAALIALGTVGCAAPGGEIRSATYSVDLALYPKDEDCMGYGKITEVLDGELLVIPGSDMDKEKYGEVVSLVTDDAYAYSVGQVVTYIFRDIKAPDTEGGPLKIIALSVYME